MNPQYSSHTHCSQNWMKPAKFNNHFHCHGLQYYWKTPGKLCLQIKRVKSTQNQPCRIDVKLLPLCIWSLFMENFELHGGWCNTLNVHRLKCICNLVSQSRNQSFVCPFRCCTSYLSQIDITKSDWNVFSILQDKQFWCMATLGDPTYERLRPQSCKTDFCHRPGQLGFPAASGFYFPRAWIAWTHLLLGPLTCFCKKPKLATARPFQDFKTILPGSCAWAKKLKFSCCIFWTLTTCSVPLWWISQ